MLRYSFNRLLRSLLTLVIIIAVVFSLLRLMPIEGYFDNFDKMSPTQIQNKLTLMGLNDPLYRQLGRFMWRLLHGDLGTSYKTGNPVLSDFLSRLGCSAQLALLSTSISLVLGVSLIP